jgi:hypothetical protein
MQMEKAPTLRRKALYAGTILGVVATTTLAVATPSWAADAAAVSPGFGPEEGGNSVTLTVGTSTLPFIQGDVYVVFEGAATCTDPSPTPTADTDVAASDVRVISTKKLAVTVPVGVDDTNGDGTDTNEYSVCAYDANDDLLAGDDAGYVVGPTPEITTVTPSASPSSGGGELRITGTSLDDVTVAIGGTAVTRTNGADPDAATVFEGTIPTRAAGGPFPIVVTYANGGSATEAAAFTYSNGIVVTPNTAPNTQTRTDLSIEGVGFDAMSFTTTNGQTPNDSNAHVYLVKGEYSPVGTATKANGQTTECLNVLRISNNELVCSLYLAGGGVPMSSPRTVSATVSGTSLTAANGNFGPGDLGMAVTGSTSIPVGTYITSVNSATNVTLSRAATANISTATTLNLAAGRVFSVATLTASDDTITSSTAVTGAQFTSADVGRVISGTGIPSNPPTTITAVNSATSATLSADATGTATGNYTITYTAPLNPVPNGTYTVTVVSNGGIGVTTGANADASFNKSIISSGSTFTVADY